MPMRIPEPLQVLLIMLALPLLVAVVGIHKGAPPPFCTPVPRPPPPTMADGNKELLLREVLLVKYGVPVPRPVPADAPPTQKLLASNYGGYFGTGPFLLRHHYPDCDRPKGVTDDSKFECSCDVKDDLVRVELNRLLKLPKPPQPQSRGRTFFGE